MKHELVIILGCLVSLALCCACGPSALTLQAGVATTIVVGVEAAEREQGIAAIRAAKTKEDAEAALMVVRGEWVEVRRLQDAYVKALRSMQAGGDLPAVLNAKLRLFEAYCGLRARKLATAPSFPDFPLESCEAPDAGR